MMLQNLAYELSMLAKAVQHKNLSAAAIHVGLSQPQLSRLIAKIEAELNVVLLDRSAPRKSGWTVVAQELSLTFTRGLGRLQNEILTIVQDREPTELRIGTLEGLAHIASQFSQQCFEQLAIKTVFLDIHDFKDLDSEFLSGNLDLIFTVRSPSKKEFHHQLEVGYQQLEKISTNKDLHVYSPFEYIGIEKNSLKAVKNVLICNSLALRSHWLHSLGGTGSLPVDAQKGRGKGFYSVLLIGSDLLSPKLWSSILKLS